MTAGAVVPAVIVGCNFGLGTCMAGCVIAGVFSGHISHREINVDQHSKQRNKYKYSALVW
jgi:ribose 5-phosphate isomerase RpiB